MRCLKVPTDLKHVPVSLCPCVRLGLPTVVKLVDRETLLKEREEKKEVRVAL